MKKAIKQKALAGLAILSLSTLAFGSAVAFANSNQTKSNRTSSVTSIVSVAQAQEKALKEAKGGKVIGYEQDVKYGNNIYEVTILDGKYEKEYKIDGQSGAILKSKTKDLSRDDEDQAIIGATFRSLQVRRRERKSLSSDLPTDQGQDWCLRRLLERSVWAEKSKRIGMK